MQKSADITRGASIIVLQSCVHQPSGPRNTKNITGPSILHRLPRVPRVVHVLCRIWQKKWGKTAKGSVEIDPSDMEGTYGQSAKGQGGTRTVPGTTKLTMDTPL